jgi:hypothetical protein
MQGEHTEGSNLDGTDGLIVKTVKDISDILPSSLLKRKQKDGCQWLTLVILATQEAENRRIVV